MQLQEGAWRFHTWHLLCQSSMVWTVYLKGVGWGVDGMVLQASATRWRDVRVGCRTLGKLAQLWLFTSHLYAMKNCKLRIWDKFILQDFFCCSHSWQGRQEIMHKSLLAVSPSTAYTLSILSSKITRPKTCLFKMTAEINLIMLNMKFCASMKHTQLWRKSRLIESSLHEKIKSPPPFLGCRNALTEFGLISVRLV